MRCLLCESLSRKHICTECQERFLKPSLFKRQLTQDVQVISFYKYEEIKELILTKHTDLGYYIYKILARQSLKLFSESFDFEEKTVSIAIDDAIKSGYSHTAVLNQTLKSRTITPRYRKIRSTNNISYSGKSRAFRLQNPREFRLYSFKEKTVILVDDIITTGTTLTQAIELLQEQGKEVLFCLTLCDLQNS